MRIVRVVGPKYVVLENVAALFTRGMDQVLGTLASHGYDAEWEVVSAASVGAPHRRDRVFIIGYLADSDSTQRERSGIHTGDPNANSASSERREEKDVADSSSLRQSGSGMYGRSFDSTESSNWEASNVKPGGQRKENHWHSEPSVGGTIDGIFRELDSGLTNEEKERAGEILRVVRAIYDEEEIRDAARRLDSVSETQVLLSIMCEFSEREDQRWVEMASKEAKERTLRKLWKRIESACTPLQSQHKRQLSWKLADALRKLSCNTPSQFPQMWKSGQWEDGTLRVASRIPNRAHRLRCLGNSIVPQVAQVVAERLLQIHDGNN
jgi:site-specific DNA-cytosine methylase